MAGTVIQLSWENIDQIRMLFESDEDEAFETHGTFEKDGEDTYPVLLVNKLYHLSVFCKINNKQDEVLKHLEKAREIAERCDYKCGRVVLVLLLLSMRMVRWGPLIYRGRIIKKLKRWQRVCLLKMIPSYLESWG